VTFRHRVTGQLYEIEQFTRHHTPKGVSPLVAPTTGLTVEGRASFHGLSIPVNLNDWVLRTDYGVTVYPAPKLIAEFEPVWEGRP
jgi:hypothetical protein